MPTLTTNIPTPSELAGKIANLKAMISDSQTPDPDAVVTILDAMGKYADVGVKNKSTLLSLGIIGTAVDFMASSDKKICKSAVAFIASCTDLNESIPDAKRLITVLVSILKTQDQADMLDEAAAALANVSKDCILKIDASCAQSGN
jgi:hypothetical protein